MKMLGYGPWAVLALLLILAVPMRADAKEHWNHHWYHYHHVVVPAYGIVPAYRVAPSYVTVPSIVPSYAALPSYGVVPSYGIPTVVPGYAPYPYHLSKHQMAAYNRLGRMERYAATHPIP
jgi:hypothetical protein